VGNGLMIDAEDYGVVFDNISNSYWGPRYLGARRIVQP
jgi:cell wall-associated NlpC family hydrolase